MLRPLLRLFSPPSRRLLRRFHRDTRGGVAIITAALMPVLMVLAGMALDFQRAALLKIRLQQVADAAILAAGAESQTLSASDLSSAASRYLAANPVPAGLATVSVGGGTYDAVTRIVELRINGQLNTSMLRVLGIRTLSTGATARALKTTPGPMEIAIALDATQSMTFALPGSSRNKMQAVQDQVSSLIDTLKQYPEAKMAIVPFYMYSNVGSAFDYAPWMKASSRRSYQAWAGYVGVRSTNYRATIDQTDVDQYPYIYPAGSVTQMVPLTNVTTGSATLLATLNSTTASGSSFVPMGLTWAWNALTPEAPLTEAKTKTEMSLVGGRKVLLVITDGGNNVVPQADGTLSIIGSVQTSNDLQKQICDNVKADGIEIYAVNYLDSSTSNQDLLRNCASDADHYYNVTNATDLQNAFKNITDKFSMVRLIN